MALRTIIFNVGAEGTLTPATVQDGGIQGDHKKTEVHFKFSDELHAKLMTYVGEAKLVYRFDAYDGEGKRIPTDTSVLTEQTVVFPLEYFITRHGGIVKIELVISKVTDVESEEVIKTATAELKLAFSPYSTGDREHYDSDISFLVEVAKKCAAEAEEAKKATQEAKEETERLKSALQNGATYIFKGGNASGVVDAKFVIDSVMSDYSQNAVQNKVVKAYVDGLESSITENTTNNVTEKAFPVNSVVITSENVNPSERLGGEWELFDKEFREQTTATTDAGNNTLEDDYFKMSTPFSSLRVTTKRIGHTVSISANAYVKENLTTSQTDKIPVCDFSFKNLGFDKLAENADKRYIYFVGYIDATTKAIVMMNIDLHSGKLYIADIINAEKENTINKSDNITFSFDIDVQTDKMFDEACNKFYWKKKQEIEGE